MQDPMWLTFGQFGHRGYHTMSNREKQLREFHIPEMFRHDYGGNAWAGQVSLVGGSGPELRYETSNARYMPAQDTARGGGGSVEMHFHFPNAAIVDGRTVEQAARLVKPALDRLAGRR
jgi:hypothetical protein